MHPILTETEHPLCVKEIKALFACHDNHPLKKFVGFCSSIRADLDVCLHKEYLIVRAQNHEKAKLERQRYEEKKQAKLLLLQQQQQQQQQQ